MKKCGIFLSLVGIFFMTGCTQKRATNIEGLISQNNHEVIGIHYPSTGISSLDQEIKKYVFSKKKYFETILPHDISLKGMKELNIDYQYEKIDCYHNIVLTTFISSPFLTKTLREVKTFVYDESQNNFLSLQDVVSLSDLQIQKEFLKNSFIKVSDLEQIPFTFSNHSIFLYFNPKTTNQEQIITTEIPYSSFKISLKVNHEKQEAISYPKKKQELSLGKPTIALTFDDGPSKYTKEIVSLLNEYESNATFFILGNKVSNYKETLTFLLESGNELGNHSYNHKHLSRLSKNELKEQIEKTNQIVKKTLNYDIQFLRPTYGALSKQIKEYGMEIVLWNVDTKDWKFRNGKKIVKNTLPDIEDGKIILMHDIYESTVDALKIMLPKLKKQGYQIVNVSELKKIQELKNEKN